MACSNKPNGACCPPAQIFKEKICGNFVNTSDVNQVINLWTAPRGDYIQGNFQVFYSTASIGVAEGRVIVINIVQGMVTSTPGNTISQTFMNPTNFSVVAEPGVSGTYCITVYKRTLA
jgi:hypothetical protein